MNLERLWDTRASSNAPFWVLTNKKDWNLDDFFEQGKKDIEKYALPYLQKTNLLNKGLSALDVGCGLGRLTLALSPYFKTIIGVDVSAEMIRQGKALHNLDLRQGQAIALPVLDNTIDYAFSFITFQHFPSQDYVLRAFSQIFRVLRQGGHAQIQVRATPSLGRIKPYTWVSFNRLWIGLARIRGIPVPCLGIAGFRGSLLGVAFKPNNLVKKLREMGFSSVLIEKENHRHLWVYLQK